MKIRWWRSVRWIARHGFTTKSIAVSMRVVITGSLRTTLEKSTRSELTATKTEELCRLAADEGVRIAELARQFALITYARHRGLRIQSLNGLW
jgi:hypothetical protein